MPKNTIIEAKTYTCQYVEREDRLLLTINYQDISNRVDFWITRKFLLKLLPYFFDYMSSVPQAIEKQNNSNGTTSTDTSTFVLTQKEPFLLDSVDLGYTQNGDIKIVFKNTEKNIFCVGALEHILFENLVELITKSVPVVEWGAYNIK